jgi:hypothetical protein
VSKRASLWFAKGSMKPALLISFLLGVSILFGCEFAPANNLPSVRPVAADTAKAPRNSATVIHVFVALCDNVNQGIVPVSASLGNGEDPLRNLYWGAAFGVKAFFAKNKDWELVSAQSKSSKSPTVVLDRVIFKRRGREAFLVAEAYRGSYIEQATQDFLAAASGVPGETVDVSYGNKSATLHLEGSANLIAYIGHDGLMDFPLRSFPKKRDNEKRDAIILACASKNYFTEPLRSTGARPLLWTTNLMAPEAYILSAAIDGWLNNETDEQVRLRAAKAYNLYQHCGRRSANRLFATGW